jgi:hypothetical protein
MSNFQPHTGSAFRAGEERDVFHISIKDERKTLVGEKVSLQKT